VPDFDPADQVSTAGLMGQIVRQVAMVGYVDAFRLLFILAAIITPLCLIMRSTRKPVQGPVLHLE